MWLLWLHSHIALFPVEWIRLSLTRYSLWFCSSISYWIIKVSLWLASLRSFSFFEHVSHSAISMLSRSVTAFTHTITVSTSCPLSLCHLVFQSLPPRQRKGGGARRHKGRGSEQLYGHQGEGDAVNEWTRCELTGWELIQVGTRKSWKKTTPIFWRLFSFWICGLKGR